MNQWALLWSRSQNALHVEPLERMLSINRESYRDNEAMDYIPLHIGTQEEVDAAADACRDTLQKRNQSKLRRVV